VHYRWGLAGLTAAYELTKLNCAVTVLEASSRIGGRVWTHRFRDNTGAEVAYGELGAMRIPHDHELVFRYVNELGLQDPTRFVNKNYNGFLYVGDRCFRRWKHEDAARHLWRAADGAFPKRLRKDPFSLMQSASKSIKDPLTAAARYSIFDSDINKSLDPHKADEVTANHSC
jgi:monoamine oxidase